MDRLRGLLCAATLIAVLPAARAQAPAQEAPGFVASFLSAVNDTMPAGLKPRDQRASGWGWFGDQWDGMGTISTSGQTQGLMTAYTWHPPYAYDNRKRLNSYPFGGGVARMVIDSKDNERIVYAMAFSDSHYDIEPIAGYAWIPRWTVAGNIKAGFGYTVFLTTRADYNWIPFPAILPIVSLGTDAISLYANWIPFSDVGFVFLRISPELWKGSLPALDAQERQRNSLLFAALAYTKTDAGGIDDVDSTSGWGPYVGYRHYFSERFALELNATEADSSVLLRGRTPSTFRRQAMTLAAQYHFPLDSSLRLYTGLGATYERFTDQQILAGAAFPSGGLSPAVQLGATWFARGGLTVNAGLQASFPRSLLTLDGREQGTVRLAPVSFTLGAGYAF